MSGKAISLRQKPRAMGQVGRSDPASVALIMDAIETQKGPDRLYLALAFDALAFQALSRNSPGPAQRELCDTRIAIIQNLVPKHIWDLLQRARERNSGEAGQ